MRLEKVASLTEKFSYAGTALLEALCHKFVGGVLSHSKVF